MVEYIHSSTIPGVVVPATALLSLPFPCFLESLKNLLAFFLSFLLPFRSREVPDRELLTSTSGCNLAAGALPMQELVPLRGYRGDGSGAGGAGQGAAVGAGAR